MQTAFEARLKRLRWNNFDGYEKSEPYRHMIEDVLILDQGFLDVAIHPIVKGIVKTYLGDNTELTEARGWRSLPTKRDFHGWHGDAWYDQDSNKEIPRELKLAFYLTDVRSGAFNYIRGSHRKQHPRPVPNVELGDLSSSEVVEMFGPAGSAFMFDTSGIHRQGVPMLERRHAIFFNYHDPRYDYKKVIGSFIDITRCCLTLRSSEIYLPRIKSYSALETRLTLFQPMSGLPNHRCSVSRLRL